MAHLTVATIKRLFSMSGNQCAFPGCAQLLVDPSSGIVTGEICFIRASAPTGPRYDPEQTEWERQGFTNLVLMCPTHHRLIDARPETYTAQALLEIKAAHEARHGGGVEPSGDIAQEFAFPLPRSLPDQRELPKPGPLPLGSRIPFRRNQLFTGREEPLKTLARWLLYDQNPTMLAAQVLLGSEGVGKTQLAVEFAYRYGRFFKGVHWLNATRPRALEMEVAHCGVVMELPDWPNEVLAQAAWTLNAWRREGRRLVVLDNLNDIKAARTWTGRFSGGAVRLLVTTRRKEWPSDMGVMLLPIEGFRRSESISFLRNYLPNEGYSNAELETLAEQLQDLPLALELAGQYLISNPELSVAAYLDQLEHLDFRRTTFQTAKEKGDYLEDAVRNIFESQEGFTVIENVRKRTAEIDLTVVNRLDDPWWIALQSPLILVECKHQERKIEPKDLRNFEVKIIDRRSLCRLGIVISTSGFTSGCFEAAARTGRDNYKIILIDDTMRDILYKEKLPVAKWLEEIIARQC